MSAKLDGPIAGQSLTRGPGNAPWEQPPMIADAQQALMYHASKFEDEEVLDDTIFLLDQGFPLQTLVESILTMAVMDGVHTLDVSILIGPALHEYLKALAEAADVQVVEKDGPTKAEKMAEKKKNRFLVMLQGALSDNEGPSPLEGIKEQLGGTAEPTMTEEPLVNPLEAMSEGGPPKGLMSRRPM